MADDAKNGWVNTNEWTEKVSNIAQLGGIETAVIDNGPGRGSRIAWINTGSGLRYKVLLDRAMDIGDAFMGKHGLAWISHQGTVRSMPAFQKGVEWLRTFGGGLMTTCGLSHVGGPEEDEHGVRGLHGEISNSAATVEQIVQPDPRNGNYDMYITGRMLQSTVFGPHIELKRTLSSRLGSPEIRIEDEVRNIGNTSIPHMLLYHMNFGWPLVDEGSRIIWNGSWESRDSKMDRKIFREGENYKICQGIREDHSGSGEAAAFIDPDADRKGQYSFGVMNERLDLGVMVTADKTRLPALTNWQHWGRREYVLGLEPGTHHPIGQKKAREDGSLIFLEPGESRNYQLLVEVTHFKENT